MGSLWRPLTAIPLALVIQKPWVKLSISRPPSGMERHGSTLLGSPCESGFSAETEPIGEEIFYRQIGDMYIYIYIHTYINT